MKIIEPINDVAMIGCGIVTVEIEINGLPACRSLVALFYQKENREVIVNFLFFEIRIK